MIGWIGGLCAVVALASGALALRSFKQLRDLRRVGAVLDTVPLVWFRCSVGKPPVAENGTSYSEFLREFSLRDAAQIEAARLALETRGTPFSAILATRRGSVYEVEGRWMGAGHGVLSFAGTVAAVEAERARREAAELRGLLDTVAVPIWRRNPDNTLADCNQAYANAVDTTRDLALSEGRELVSGARSGDRRHIVIGGSRRLLEIREVPCEAGGTVGFAVDRTELETADTKLRRHVEAHARVLEGIRAAVAVYGSDRRLIFFNTAFASMWGLREGWLAAQPSFSDVLEQLREVRRLPEVADFQAFKRQQLQIFTSLIEAQHEVMHLPDGRTLLLSISPHPFGGLIFVYEDVTSRLALERSCNTLTQVRRATLDHLFEGLAVFGGDGRLKLYNPAYLTIWGLSANDLAGEPHILDIIEKTRRLLDDGGDWAAMKQKIAARLTGHALASGTVRRNDGSTLQEATVPLPDGNVLVAYLDISDAARYERILRERNEALETAERLKSEFLANLSHGLRTPLNAIIGFAEILTNQYFGDLNPSQLDYSRSIQQASAQLLMLVDDLLDLATIEAGDLVLEPVRVEVFELLQRVTALTREHARSRGIRVELHCPPATGAIEADERRIKQALMNLTSNAVKFTAPGGTVSIGAERTESELLLSVADTGIGGASATRQADGGLGLSLVKKLVGMHGGSVMIDSALERGARITCRFPAAAGARARSAV